MQFPFFGKKHHQLIYTLLISKKTVGACIWHVDNGAIFIDGISDLSLWDEDVEDSLFQAADTAIGSLGEIDATQVLLALPDDWVQGQGIHPKRKGMLRALTEQLELSSVGFVVSVEAVIAHLKETASQPLNTVSACVDPDAFIMAIVTQSQSSPIFRIGRSDRVTDDFLEGCSRLKATGVPPHMVLFSLSESEQSLAAMKHELESYSWDPQIFVQKPTIRIESPAFVLTAVTQAGGREVLKALPELAVADESESTPVSAPEFSPVPVPQNLPPDETVELDAHTDPEDTEGLKPSRKLQIFGGAVLMIGLILVLGYFFLIPKLVKVQVSLRRKSSELTGSTQLRIQAGSDTASGSATVIGALVPLSVSGEIEIPTTGQKKTGDVATGTVSIFNLSSASKQFKSGTALKSGKIVFETSEDVTVASASTGANYEKIPGKASAKVKASSVGEEGNIAKNVELSIGGFDASAFVARSENPFTGGTSRTVNAVASKDQDSAVASLTTTLKQKITESLTGNLDSGQDGFILSDVTLSGKKFTATVGEETGSLGLSMSASASALVYSRLDALSAAAGVLDTSIPAGAKLDQSAVTVERTSVKKVSGQAADVSVTVAGSLTLPIDSAQFASILAGKSLEDARSFLDGQAAVQTYTWSIRPSILSAFIRVFPKDPGAISITVE